MAKSKPAGNGWYMPQLNIVLLGGRNSGKSSVGNLLLGKEEFVTKERTCCSRRVGMMGGHWLTVVDTPGWWCDLSSQDTSELVKREIVCSLSLCNPGPHAFVIVVKGSSIFTEQRRTAVEEHLNLLGGAVWDHCVLVIAFTDNWRLTEAEEHVQRGGKALQWLYDRCAHRCHSLVVNDDTRVKELLMKIQKLVAANGNAVFEMPEKMLQRVLDEKRRLEERAHRRFVSMKKMRATQKEKLRHMTDIRIVLLGARGSGKSSVFNTILSINQNDNHGRTRTARCHVGDTFVFGRRVTVVDTPGWWCNYFCEETPQFDKREMILSLSLCPPGPHAFLLVIRVDRAFRDTHRRAVEEHIELIGKEIWNRMIVVFSFGDWLGTTTTEQFIESEGKPLQWVVDRCSNRYHMLNNKTKGDGFQVRELIGKLEEMVATCDSDWYFEIENSVIRNLEQKMREETDGAKERRRVKDKQRRTARATLDDSSPLSDMNIVLIGACKTGKSSCGNTILARNCFKTQTTSSNSAKVNDKMVTVLDTPGSFCVTNDLLKTSSAFLLVVNVSSAFKEVHLKAMEDWLTGEGLRIWPKAMVLFSFGDWLGDTTIEQRIESEGRPLQRLIERCGNRYHVLDNKMACKAQVSELIWLIEGMMAEESLVMFQNGDRMTKEIRQKQELEAVHNPQVKSICQLQSSPDLPESAFEGQAPSQTITQATTGQIIPLSERTREVLYNWNRRNFVPSVESLPNGKSRLFWTDAGQMLAVNLPVWTFGDDLHANMRLQGERPTSSAMVLFLPHAQSSPVDTINPARSLCHPMLIDRTLRRLSEYGGLQNIIDQWGDSSLEELEAFIDLYFETLWEQTMGSCQVAERESPTTEEAEEDVLAKINRKLTKLDVLEEIKEDLSMLRKSIEQSVKAMEELKGKTNKD